MAAFAAMKISKFTDPWMARSPSARCLPGSNVAARGGTGGREMQTLALALLLLALFAGCGDDDTTSSAGSADIQQIQIETGGFMFDALVAGPESGEPVLLLHGFPSSNWQWREQLEALGVAGYRAVAPNQRGYSAGARPPAIADYAMPNLILDVTGIADALGWERFHLVGHDWGAAVAWVVGVFAPDRLLTLNPISIPHPDAFNAERMNPDSCQFSASGYINDFVQPGYEDVFLAGDSMLLRGFFEGVTADAVARHVELLGNPEAMRAALNWYRANASSDSGLAMFRLGSIGVPTLFMWSDEDIAICRESAEATADYIDAPYRFEVFEGVNHWITEIEGERVADLLLDHFRSVGR
jgi:pimeloyl-ACP methyl ester carboxylesterase